MNQAHRFKVGQSTTYIEPETGARHGVIILSQIFEDDGSPVYGVMFDDGRKSCIPDDRLDIRFVIDWIDCPGRKAF